MLEYLRTKRVPVAPEQWEAKDTSTLIRDIQRVTKRAARYQWDDDGSLYRILPDKTTRVRVPKPDEREALIAETHGMGHLGFMKTYDMVRKRFWWERMRQEVAASRASGQA